MVQFTAVILTEDAFLAKLHSLIVSVLKWQTTKKLMEAVGHDNVPFGV